ncbi:hypothetical protein BYT27DRAFT_7132131 [Phlegmacium glaucopus]|nr:hypothetical protein BYT27DRAFT_7132131 [Phlegmacium glaucopus]
MAAPPVALPPQSNDLRVPLPAAPVFPPTINDVLAAIRYHKDVEISVNHRPLDARCTRNDYYNSVLYEHSIIAQAAAAAGPQAVAPRWFQGAIQQLRVDLQNDMRSMIRAEILPDLKRLMNKHRGEGIVVPFEVVPFTNGSDPTQPPNNLPPLHSINVIENLNENDLVEYLTGYGVIPPVGANQYISNHLQKETLKGLVRAL